MRAPSARGEAICEARIDDWTRRFAGYRQEVTAERISNWLDQFQAPDQDMASRLLDCVEYISHDDIEAAFRAAISALPGWDDDPDSRRGKWRFVAFSTTVGESGDTMLHRFRTATGMTAKRYKDLFIHRSELLIADLGPEDTVVFLDDFSGTGDQVCDGWRDVMEELLPDQPNAYLLLVAGSEKARKRIEEETLLTVHPGSVLTDDDNVFSDSCTHFSNEEKTALLRYCTRANRRDPKGWGECGFLIVLAHKAPNNSVPVLHARHRRWEGLFPRE